MSPQSVQPVTSPLAPSACRREFHNTPCYDAGRLREIYGVAGLARRGIEGQGTTVALVSAYRDPVLVNDLDTYARQAGLPRPNVTLIKRGHPAIADPRDVNQAGFQEEITLDSEMILAMAPRTHLVIVENQADASVTPRAFGDALKTVTWLAKRMPVDAVSFSYGFFELNYAEATGWNWPKAEAMMRSQAEGLRGAEQRGVTVVTADGDTGSAAPNLSGTAVYSQPTVAFVAAYPGVTSVSGSAVQANDQGVRTRLDTVWSDTGSHVATGGGVSEVFARPGYQARMKGVVGAHRGVGDVSMDGSEKTPVWVYTSRYQILPGQVPGWVRVAGTSAASPLFTGVVALAAQVAGHPLGQINPRLYWMARNPARYGVQDITKGCNGDYGVPGFCAGLGPDLPSGIGTVGNGRLFVPALAGKPVR